PCHAAEELSDIGRTIAGVRLTDDRTPQGVRRGLLRGRDTFGVMRANCAWWSWLAIAALGVAVALAGCGGAGSGSGGHGGGSPAGTGGQAGTTATGTGGQAGTGQSGAGGGQAGAGGLGGAGGQAPTSYAITFGPLQVGPGVEDTQCVVVRLGNSAAIHVGQVHNQAGPAAVQMILYTSTDTTEQ